MERSWAENIFGGAAVLDALRSCVGVSNPNVAKWAVMLCDLKFVDSFCTTSLHLRHVSVAAMR